MCEKTEVELKFRVESFRKIPNPYSNLENGPKETIMYIAICDVKELPDNIPMKTNPRDQKLTTNVAKKIKQSLLNTSDLDFYLLNRGMLISAKSVSFNNYSNEMTVLFDDLDVHGNVDGGHTYKTILTCRDQLDPGQQFVKLELLAGVESIFQNLAAARNISVAVQDKSIAELEKRFDIIKKAIEGEHYSDKVYFKENEEGDIDVTDLLAVLNMFNIDRYPNIESFPITSYSGKKKCVDYYIESHKMYGESLTNPYVKMIPIIKDIFKLYDKIETGMNKFYKQKNSSGRYGAVKGVIVPKSGVSLHSKYYETEMEAGSPAGFIYPVLGSLRALVEEKDGQYCWKKNPFAVLESVGADLVETTVERSRSLGNNPQSVGKDSGNWKTLYMTVVFSLIS